MMRSLFLLGVLIVTTLAISGQTTRTSPRFPAGVPAKETGIEALGGKVADRTYSNSRFEFEVTVPENWYIAGNDFEKVVRAHGHDLSIDPLTTKSARQIDVLLTAFRSDTGRHGAVLRVTAEDLRANPQIRDAVDYFDAITAAYSTSKLPPDFSYSATKAERLGPYQFAFLDTASNSGRKRLYATVIKQSAIMFTLSYTNDDDLQTLKKMLANGKFPRK